MANKWTIKALELEEILRRYQCVPYIMHWETAKGKYGYVKKGDPNSYYSYISFAISFSSAIVSLTAIIWKATSKNEHHSPLLYGSWFMLLLFATLSTGIDFVLIRYRDDFVICLNLLMEYGEQIAVIEKKSNKPSTRISPTKISWEDQVGKFLLATVAILHLAAPITVPFVYIVQPNLDSNNWLLNKMLGLMGWDYENLSNTLQYCFAMIKVLLGIVVYSELSRTISHLCGIMILETPIFNNCLKHYKKYPLGYPVLSLYDKLFRIRMINVKACGELTTTTMGIAFVMLTFTHVVCVYGWNIFNPFLYFCFILIVIIQNVLLHTLLPLVTKLYDMSNASIQGWKLEVSQIGGFEKKREISKILRHTRPISFACGGVGTLRRESKRNYLSNLLDQFISVTMTLKPFL